MTSTQAEHCNNAGHHYAQALHHGLDHAYEVAHQAALTELHQEALDEDDTRRTSARPHAPGSLAWNLAEPTIITKPTTHLPRAYWLDDDLLSGMFAAMTHRELHDEYGLQEIIIFDEDYSAMFDLR